MTDFSTSDTNEQSTVGSELNFHLTQITPPSYTAESLQRLESKKYDMSTINDK